MKSCNLRVLRMTTALTICLGLPLTQVNAEEISISGNAHHGHHHSHDHHNHSEHNVAHAYGPASVMGDHMHEKGDWMLSYRYMRMEMKDNRDGTDSLGLLDISGVVPNRFFGIAGQPSTLRIVPTQMTMDMHMLSAMYAPTDWLTLMVMANYVDKEMDHVTFAAMAPTTQLGTFTTSAEGIGDTKVSGLFRLYEEGRSNVIFKAGVSLPTGSIDETDTILNPMNAQQTIRLPYAMQLGSGTYDLQPSLTYTGHSEKLGWGLQYNGIIRTGTNDEGYTLGDKHQIQGWTSYSFRPEISGSIRLAAETEDSIDDIDDQIVGPVQTADPDNYGGERIELGLGMNFLGSKGTFKGHHVGFEIVTPLYQDLNGPQLERDLSIGFSWRKSF